jgi:xylulokinase
MSVLLGLDIGTSTVKALAYDPETGFVSHVASRPTPVSHPVPEYSEHCPQSLWETVTQVLREVSSRTGERPIAGLAISSFAEAGLPIDADGNPLYPIIAWYDRRSEPQAVWWDERLSADELHAITGQNAKPNLGVNKYMWLRENRPDVIKRMARWVSTPDYILWKLCGEYATDFSMASRTMLFDQRYRGWSVAILEHVGLTTTQLPELHCGGTVVGGVSRLAAEHTGIPAGTLCVLGGHDHLCAMVASGAYRLGTVIDSCGTAQALIVIIPTFSSNAEIVAGGYSCYAHVIPNQYVFKGGLHAAGGAIEWWARHLTGQETPDELIYARLSVAAEMGMGMRAGPLWLPHLLGSGTPEGDRHSRGALIGVRAEHDQGDLFRAMLEGLAFWQRHNLDRMAQLTGQATDEVRLLGGTTRLQAFVQSKATILNLPLTISNVPEAAATGAALLAGVGTGLFADLKTAVDSLGYQNRIVFPNEAQVTWYEQLYQDAYLPLYDSLRDIHHTLSRF